MKTQLINFKRWFLFVFVPVAFIGFESCQTYQFVTLSSDLPQDAGRKFVYESDTITIKYSFSGRSCPITIDIYNKSPKPICIDWSQSSIIFDDQSFSVCPQNSYSIDNLSQDNEYQEDVFMFAGYEMSNNFSRDQLSFIAPHSNIKVNPMNLVNEWLPTSITDSISRGMLYCSSGPVNVKRYKYNVSKSPLFFRCYLTYYNQAERGNVKHVDHQFWASEIYKSQVLPQNNLASQYYMSKTTAFGNFMSALGVIFVSVGTLYLATLPE